MSTATKKLNIKFPVEKSLKILSERNRTILAARHGIGTNGRKNTLESIGSNYNITRERVRQIEEASYGKIRSSNQFNELSELEEACSAISDFLQKNCGVATEDRIVNSLVTEKQAPYLRLLLHINHKFSQIKESETTRVAWALDEKYAETAKQLLSRIEEKLAKKGKAVGEDQLKEIIFAENKDNLEMDGSNINSILEISKNIRKGPYGYWGMANWPEITPKGVRDKVYLVLKEQEKPMHFRDLARLIDGGPFYANKKTHPQTVHNELIKDERFVLIGRGIYALKSWGYIPGTVKDVIMNILQNEGKPMDTQEIIEKVFRQRNVQRNTVLLNLQNKSHFKKVDSTRYYLA